MNSVPQHRLRRVMFAGMAVLAVCLLHGIVRAEDPAAMDAEIDYLVNAVAASNCTFIRNGTEHDAVAASKHLAMKRQRGRRYYSTTEQFIDRIASRSSWSGKDYLIRCGGETVTAGAWFTDRLAEYRSDHP